MKTLAELEAIRRRTLEQISLRKDDRVEARVVVGMATCGIAAGARPVMLEFVEEIKRRNLSGITVSQTGCIGVCRLEPIVEIYVKDQEKVTYCARTPENVASIVTAHLVNAGRLRRYDRAARNMIGEGNTHGFHQIPCDGLRRHR
jgi:NADP-reducing hydrogenase subunit HndB